MKTPPDGNPIKINQTLITFDSMLPTAGTKLLMEGGSQKGFESSGFFSIVFSLPDRNVVFFFLSFCVRSGFCANLV